MNYMSGVLFFHTLAFFLHVTIVCVSLRLQINVFHSLAHYYAWQIN